jgi:signal transduction histidine kinase
MIRKRRNKLGLSLVFSLFVLAIYLITFFIMIGIGILLSWTGLMHQSGPNGPYTILIILLPASVIVGTIVSFIFGGVPLKPIREFIDATNKLAAGDFSARLTMSRPAEFLELRDSFNRMAGELSSIEMLRNDFVNNFSHEFKTPIVSIKGFAEVLKLEDLTKEERDEYLDIIIRESARLAAMATNVLNLSKIENQTILTDIKKYNLGEQIRRCILLMQSSWEQKGLTFEVDMEDVFIHANEELFSQVWVNMLDNAIKFSQDKGNIVVNLKNAGQFAEFTLRDYGHGISEKDLGHIFDKFYQADTSRSIPGNGLGLALAQKIIQLHHGSIVCTSKLDHGTEFIVRLPLE